MSVCESNASPVDRGRPLTPPRWIRTTVEKERILLQEFLDQFPQFTVSVNVKLRSLQEIPDRTTIWGHYIGQTIHTDPTGRYEEDLKGSADTMLKKWMAFTQYDWDIYEVLAFRTPLGQIYGSPSDIWRARTDLQELEYGLILGADKRGWNAAPGGLPQTSYCTPPDLSRLLSELPVLEAPSPRSLPNESLPNGSGSWQLPSQAPVRQHFQENYSMGPAILNRTVNQASDFADDATGTSRLLLVGSRITQRGSKSEGDW